MDFNGQDLTSVNGIYANGPIVTTGDIYGKDLRATRSTDTGVVFLGSNNQNYLYADGGQTYIAGGPSLKFNGNEVFTAGNFNPSSYAVLGSNPTFNSVVAPTIQADKLVADNSSGAVGSATYGVLETRGINGDQHAAFMTFHRPNRYAANFGLDTDNKLKFGGISAGSAYEVYHEGNTPFLTPEQFGAKGDGSTDDTNALRDALTRSSTTGLPIRLSPKTYRITDTLIVPSRTTIYGPVTAVIKLVIADGAEARPVLMTARAVMGATEIVLRGFTVDQNAYNLSSPTVSMSGFNNNPAYGSAVILRSNDSTLDSLTVLNGWDNCIMVGDHGLASENALLNPPQDVPGLPNRPLILNCRTRGGGCGYHSTGPLQGRNGVGVDISGAADFIVKGCIDFASATGFITDTGGGARGLFDSCISINARCDFTHDANGSGVGFQIQSNQTRVVNCTAMFADLYGFMACGDPNVDRTGSFESCLAYGTGAHGFWINASFTLVACIAQNCGQIGSTSNRVFDGFCVQGTFHDVNYSMLGCRASDATGKMRWGLNESTSIGFPYGTGQNYSISGQLAGCVFVGSTGNKNLVGKTGEARLVTRQVLGSTGYRVWSDGEIEQWGLVGGNSSADTPVVYPIPFTSAVWDVSCSSREGSNNANIATSVQTYSINLTGFTGAPRFNANGSVGRAGEAWSWYAKGI